MLPKNLLELLARIRAMKRFHNWTEFRQHYGDLVAPMLLAWLGLLVLEYVTVTYVVGWSLPWSYVAENAWLYLLVLLLVVEGVVGRVLNMPPAGLVRTSLGLVGYAWPLHLTLVWLKIVKWPTGDPACVQSLQRAPTPGTATGGRSSSDTAPARSPAC